MNGTMDYYNKAAAKWAASGYSDDSEIPCLKAFLAMLDKGARVLDLGCGCGYDCKRLRERGFSPIGLDFSEESLRIAREQNPGIEFLCENMLSDYSKVGSVDAIIAIACLVHIESKDLSTAFRQMSTVLKSGGLVLLSIRFGNGKIDAQSFRTVDGEEFDRNFVGHNIDEILEASGRWFEYVTELETDMPIWEYYALRKK